MSEETSEKKLDYLKKQIDGRIRTTSRSKSKYLYQYRYFSLGLSFLAASNTFLIAMSEFGGSPNKIFAVAALAVSAFLTVISAWQAAINPKEKFIKNADALNDTVDIRENLRWKSLEDGKTLTNEEIDIYFKQFRALEKQFFGSLTQTSIQDSE